MSKRKTPQPKEMMRAIWFTQDLLRTDLWLEKADSLLRAAARLEPDIETLWSDASKAEPPARGLYDVREQHFMLVAYAIENLCKAAAIHQRRESYANRLATRVPGELSTHDLRRLWRLVGMPMSVRTEGLLVRLTGCSEWSGRYPVPLSWSKYRDTEELSDGARHFVGFFAPDDVPRIKSLVEVLRGRVEEILRE